MVMLAGCSPPTAVQEADGPLKVYASMYPVQAFAERVGGAHVEVTCPVESDPASWMPGERDILAMQEADLIVLNGANFEAWPDKVSLPESRLLRTAAGVELLHYEDAVVHSHGPSGAHSHEGIDGHTWLDPQNAKRQADAIRQALSRLRPANAADFAANFAKLAADLDALDAAFRQLSPPPMLANHPAYNYLARRYGWTIHNLDLDPGEMPADEVLVAIRNGDARVLLWEAAPLAEIATRLEQECKVKSIVFSPCETAPASGDYLDVMRRNLAWIIHAIRRERG